MTTAKILGTLDIVELRDFWLDEAKEFTPWLAKPENLATLSTTLDMELELEGIEISVGPYKADIVARDASSDEKVIIENQLDKTNHDHLGKIITYASGLDAKVIIWIAREFTEEHRRAIDFINENAAPNLRCFGIVMQLWKIGNSSPAPMFKVISSPNDYTPTVIGGGKVLTETRALYLKFWNDFKEYCESTGTFLKLRKPRPRHWFSIAVGRSKFWIAITASTQKARIGCEIYMRGVNAKKAFKLLEKERQGIEQITGPLEWQELPDGQDCRIALFRQDISISDKTTWDEVFKWMKKEAETFYKAFSPRIKALPLSGDTEDDNDEEETEDKG